MKAIDLPKPIKKRSGCKVGWWYYDNLQDAQQVAAWAEQEAERMTRGGYDFGYCWPGSISKATDGLFEVTIP